MAFRAGRRPVVQIVFEVHPAEADGRQWVTVRLGGGEPLTVGYTVPRGDGVAVHGSAEGWPRIDICADNVRALAAVVGAWGQQAAHSADPGEETA
jgi:hypothetical protein